MRNGQNNNKRMRNRNNNNNNNNNNRRGQNPMTRVYELNGPDIKIRGTASHVAEKYVQLARDARSSGDPVAAENYYQHAEHYFRLIAAAQEQFRQSQPQPRTDGPAEVSTSEDGDEDGENFSHFGQEPGFAPQRSSSPSSATTISAKASPISATSSRANITGTRARASPAAAISAAAAATAACDRRHRRRRSPAVVHHRPAAADQWRTAALRGAAGGGERYPRRRRRPHGPRPENLAAAPAAPGDDFNPGNE